MLPFHDMPIVQRRSRKIAGRSGDQRQFNPKPLDPHFVAALEDPSRVVFLDIETTGLSWFYDDITIVGWMCNGTYSVYVAGEDPTALATSLRNARVLVTFNGTLFDLRFLRKEFPELALPPVHIDLRYLAKRAGLSGGQKAIEKLLRLPERANALDVDGAEAVLLWYRYLRGDRSSLLRLIEYNRYDIAGMCGILDEVLDRLDLHGDLWFSRPRFGDWTGDWLSTISDVRQASSRRRNSSTFELTFASTPAERAVAVGIDLTGSEARPSGWCVLRGAEAGTAMIASDDELVARTISAKPDIVSIDSPLSIPFGRTCVEDDDPGREEFGIMRRCERELKRRGVNVYPCLLPSMQGLTRRGMRLATRFRMLGLPVIESYPGAAQDIMGIPRKGAGEEFLRQGLADFGVTGNFVKGFVKHDELDAITSALVGSFFLAGKYEALQGPLEDPLIIPDLGSPGRSSLVVGISGPICAGKTTVARMLEGRGFAYTRFSLVIDDEIVAKGGAPDRRTRQQLGLELHRTKGQRWLCRKVLDRVADRQLIVVDGLRFPEDHAFFKEAFGSQFVHLHIAAATESRAARYVQDQQDDVPFETADHQPVEAKVGDLALLADAAVSNNSTIEALAVSVQDFTEELVKKGQRPCQSPSL